MVDLPLALHIALDETFQGQVRLVEILEVGEALLDVGELLVALLLRALHEFHDGIVLLVCLRRHTWSIDWW